MDDPTLVLQVVIPAEITDAVLVSSNVPENDYPAWAAGTAYSPGARVISGHKVYEALTATTGTSPATSPDVWLEVGATNRWKAFDRKVSDLVRQADTIEYVLAPASISDGIALFGVNAGTVRVEVDDAFGSTVYAEEVSPADTSEIVDWFSFFTWDGPRASEVVLLAVPAYPGSEVRITIDATGFTAEVGQIVLGRIRRLGRAHSDTRIGITDFSRKDRDDFGNPVIIERAFSSRATYIFSFPRSDTGRVLRAISGLRATPAVYTLGPGTSHYGTTVYGFLSGDLDIPLVAADVATASLEIEGLI